MLNFGKSCNKVVHRDYPGTPFLSGQDTCVYLTRGGQSVCDGNKFAWHRALCYCEGKVFSCTTIHVSTNNSRSTVLFLSWHFFLKFIIEFF